VDTPLSRFRNRDHKSSSKEKANSNSSFLHVSYTFCMTKKGCSYGRLRWRKLVISWCSTNDNRVFVIKSFKMGNFTNVELTDMVLAYVRRAAGGNAVQAQILFREKFPDRVYFHGATVERHRKVPSKNGRSWQRSFPVCEG
jgi:hypothetical protein